MTILFHGTTRRRAESIARGGPDPYYGQPLNERSNPGDFSTCLPLGPFPLGPPEAYAWQQAENSSDEGGPALLIFDAPDEVIDLAVTDYLPLSGGVVQFDLGFGLDELLARWDAIAKRVLPLVQQ